jgi:methanogenic corrinoid protein MtbC1
LGLGRLTVGVVWSSTLAHPNVASEQPGLLKGHVMRMENLLEQYLDPLLTGNRHECRETIMKALRLGMDPKAIYHQVLWPAMEHVDRLYRADQINLASEHMATRINRSLADQVQSRLPRKDPTGKKVLVVCADNEPEELGAQMTADLFESDGWAVYFVGGGVPHDEILSMVGQIRPDLLLVFGTQPSGVPGVRSLIDLIREVGVHPTMNVMISGGVFNRAEGLWEEINADMFAPTAQQSLELANQADPRTPDIRIPGAPKKRRRRRRPPLLESAGTVN